MVMLMIALDTQTVCPEQLRSLVEAGQVLHSTGIINTRWKETSALETAKLVGLEAVEWDYTADDSAGLLEILIWYPQQTCEEIAQRVQTLHGVDWMEIDDGRS